jgi:hypothetical protein
VCVGVTVREWLSHIDSDPQHQFEEVTKLPLKMIELPSGDQCQTDVIPQFYFVRACVSRAR